MSIGYCFCILIFWYLFRITISVGKEYNSNVAITNAWHHRSDAWSSLVALIGVTGAYFGYPIIDNIGGMLVGIILGKLSYNFAYNATYELLDADMDYNKNNNQIKLEIKKDIKNYIVQNYKKYNLTNITQYFIFYFLCFVSALTI